MSQSPPSPETAEKCESQTAKRKFRSDVEGVEALKSFFSPSKKHKNRDPHAVVFRSTVCLMHLCLTQGESGLGAWELGMDS